jgi:hypothetical protein
VMDERMRFVIRLKDGEGAAVEPKERLCPKAFIPTISGAPITGRVSAER